MPFRLSCPSCNTSFAVPELPADRRANCPRCGDVFPIRNFTEEDRKPGGDTPGSPLRSSTTERRSRGRWSVQRTLAIALVIGFGGLLAGLGVYYARGGFRPKPVPEAEGAPLLTATAPTQLSGIGYVPADSSIVFAVQVGPALAFAERSKQDPRELFIKAGIPRQLLDALASLGLTLPQIDHISGSTNAGELRLAMVLVLRRPPADEDEFLKRLKATRANGAKERYSVKLGELPLSLARVSPTVWVFGFDAKKDLEAVDRGGYGAGGKQFAQSLTAMIAERVPPDAAAWVATTDERWAEQMLVKFAIGQMGKKEWLAVLAKGRAAVVALSLEEPPRLRLFVKAADEPTAQQLRAYFAKKAAVNDLVRHGGAGEFAFFDTPTDPATIFATLQEFLR